MHDRDPRRLKHEPGTPDSLAQALQALRKGPDDSARLARVSKRLEHLMEAPPTATTGAQPNVAQPNIPQPLVTKPIATPPFGKLPLLKLVVGGLVVVAPLLWLARMQWSETVPPTAAAPSDEVHSAPAPEVAAPAPVVASPAQPAEPDTTVHAVPQRAPAAHSSRSRSTPSGKPARKRSDGSARSADSAQTRTASSSDEHASLAEPVAAATKPEEPQQPRHEPEAEPAAKPSAPEPTATRAPAVRQSSELELLFQARKATSDDAEQALRLLTEHAARFPKGQLVPEREVLIIETLRKLGRNQEAETRLQQFRARYPNSLHLQRLQH